MKREILFRGINFQKEWIYGDLIHSYAKDDVAIVYYKEGRKTPTFDAVFSESVGQYTGLKDKDGKKIFEGDILRFKVPDGTIRHFVVEWATEDRILRPLSNFVPDGNSIRISGWCFNWEGNRLYPSVIDGIPDNERMEIVGNIYDNPELLRRQ